MPTTLAIFVSSTMSLPKLKGEPENGTPPIVKIRNSIFGSAGAALISLLRLSTTSVGGLTADCRCIQCIQDIHCIRNGSGRYVDVLA